MRSRLGADYVVGGVMVVPATAMIVTGHIWLGAAIVVSVVVAGGVSARSRLRVEAAEQQGYLSYAHTATSLGADPAPVIAAMRRSDIDAEEDVVPWVHLLPLQPGTSGATRYTHRPTAAAESSAAVEPEGKGQVSEGERRKDRLPQSGRWTDAAKSVRSTAPTVLLGTSQRVIDDAAQRLAKATMTREIPRAPRQGEDEPV